MSKLLPIIFVLISFLGNSQVKISEDFSAIVESETKSALKVFQGTKNLNTGNYDLKYHRLEFTIDPNVAFISGIVTSYFEAKEDLSEITFELSNNMTVSQVLQRGTPLTFTQNNDDEVIITLSQVQNTGVLDSLSISYSGNPISSGFGSFEQSSHNGDPIIWTLSEPYGAKGWWPCKQDLNDKIDTIDIYVTTPRFNPSNEEYMLAANGLEQSQEINGSNKTTHFRHQHPIPAYLIAIAVTNYEIYTHTVANNGNPFDIVNYVYPEDLASSQASTGITVDIMNLYSDLFEEYPYANEKYGHAQFGWGGGMEHTTVSFMGGFSRGLIAHELAHQWFGDKITCGSWQDIWLNEGFATFLSGLVIENLDGESNYKSWRQDKINNITSQPDGSVYVPAQDTTSVNRVFNSRLSYNKGSMVLHMLRHKLGDEMFFQALQEYLNDANYAYGYAKTPDLKSKIENVSGEDLTEFFNDWVYGEGYPSYQLEWSRQNASEIIINLNQTQSDNSVSFFEAPLPIRVYGTGGEEEDFILENTTNGESFILNVPYNIGIIVIDPEYHIISKDNTVLLGLNTTDYISDVILFPNPAKTNIQIKKPTSLTISKIEIHDSLGRIISTPEIKESIDIVSLPKGLYFITFGTNEGTFQKTIIKE